MSRFQKLMCKLRFHKTQDISINGFVWKRCYMCGRQFNVRIDHNYIEEAPQTNTNIAFDEYEGPY